jgi:hypothetical protein
MIQIRSIPNYKFAWEFLRAEKEASENISCCLGRQRALAIKKALQEII